MKLSELEPRWIHANVFVFKCPHCREIWLSCKNIDMKMGHQIDLFAKEVGAVVVPTAQTFAWAIEGRPFETMSVTPSLDASASGHWHGFITNGEIVGGIA